MTLPELSMVRVLRQVGEVPAGTVGTIVHVYGDGEACEVEFTVGDTFEHHKHYVETVEAADLVRTSETTGHGFGITVCRRCDPVLPEHIGPEVDDRCPECGARVFGLLGTRTGGREAVR